MSRKVIEAKNEADAGRHTLIATLLGALFFTGVVSGMMKDDVWYSLSGAAAVGFAVLVWRIREHDVRAYGIEVQPEIVYIDRDVYQSPDKNYTVVGKYYIWQPAPGSFAKLLRTAIDGTKREFALRTALQMGWNEAEFNVMVSQLFAVGWFAGDRHNRAHKIEDSKLGEVREWLSSHPPIES